MKLILLVPFALVLALLVSFTKLTHGASAPDYRSVTCSTWNWMSQAQVDEVAADLVDAQRLSTSDSGDEYAAYVFAFCDRSSAASKVWANRAGITRQYLLRTPLDAASQGRRFTR